MVIGCTGSGKGLELIVRPDLTDTQILRFTRPGTARRWLRQCSAADGV